MLFVILVGHSEQFEAYLASFGCDCLHLQVAQMPRYLDLGGRANFKYAQCALNASSPPPPGISLTDSFTYSTRAFSVYITLT